jgi:hypothetical protein
MLKSDFMKYRHRLLYYRVAETHYVAKNIKKQKTKQKKKPKNKPKLLR